MASWKVECPYCGGEHEVEIASGASGRFEIQSPCDDLLKAMKAGEVGVSLGFKREVVEDGRETPQ